MKKDLDKFWFGWICGGLLALMLCVLLFPHDNGKTNGQYPGTLVVREVHEQYALAETATGFAWLIEPDDWETGDLVSAVFDDNGTPDDIRDDTLIQTRFSGIGVCVDD